MAVILRLDVGGDDIDVFESLPAMPLEALTEAADKLVEGLQQMMPSVQIESSLIGPGG